MGYSAIYLGDALRANGGKRYLSLELNPVNAAVANLLIELAGLRDIVTIHVAASHKTLAEFVRNNVIDHIEVMLIDHWKDRYLPDLWLMENLGLLKPGVTVLAADNCLRPGAPDYLEWVRATSKEKAALLKKHGFAEDSETLRGEELVKALKEGKEDVDLENVPGDPTWVYEREMTEFELGNGRRVSPAFHTYKNLLIFHRMVSRWSRLLARSDLYLMMFLICICNLTTKLNFESITA